MSEPEFRISWMTGVKELKPVEYRVTETTTGKWWWKEADYAVESEFGRLSGFSTRAEAEAAATHLRGHR